MAGKTPTRKLPPMAAGQRYGQLVAICQTGRNKQYNAIWKFLCDCGKETEKLAIKVIHGHTRSCGCLRKVLFSTLTKTHGLRRTREYKSWAALKQRCLNPDDAAFRHYGERGIKVCERWRDSFENFYADMGPRPSPKHSIDRINNDGNYEPGNCRWATASEQVKNRRKPQRTKSSSGPAKSGSLKARQRD